VQGQQVLGRAAGLEGVQVRVLAVPAAAALHPPLGPGVLYQDAAHGLGGRGEEVPAVGEPPLGFGGQPQVGLVDERGGVQGVARSFVGHLGPGHPAQLVVNERPELSGGARVAPLDRAQEMGDFVHDMPRAGRAGPSSHGGRRRSRGRPPGPEGRPGFLGR
jgi:hypothetical protein